MIKVSKGVTVGAKQTKANSFLVVRLKKYIQVSINCLSTILPADFKPTVVNVAMCSKENPKLKVLSKPSRRFSAIAQKD